MKYRHPGFIVGLICCLAGYCVPTATAQTTNTDPSVRIRRFYTDKARYNPGTEAALVLELEKNAGPPVTGQINFTIY